MAALRQVYEATTTTAEPGGGAEIRLLLERVSNHAVFGSTAANNNNGSGPVSETGGDDTQSSGVSPLFQQPTTATTTAAWQSNVESLIANLPQLCSTDSSSSSSNDSKESKLLQGLLIAMLAVLTGQEEAEASDDHVLSEQELVRNLKASKRGRRTISPLWVLPDNSVSDLARDPVRPPLLQVASVLFLLPCGGWNASDNNNNAAGSHLELGLDPGLLDYFGQAAAVFEERLELQKTRMLARMPTPVRTAITSSPTATATVEPGQSSPVGSSSGRPGIAASNNIDSSSPPALLQRILSEDGELGGHDREELMVMMHRARELEAALVPDGGSEAGLAEARVIGEALSASQVAEAALNAAFEQIMASGALSPRNEDQDPNQDSSDSDSGDDDDDDDSDDVLYEEHVNEEPGQDEELQPDEDTNDGGDENAGSSSSSSSEDGAMLESERGLDTDEEDDPIMRRALAMSLAQRRENAVARALLDDAAGEANTESVRVVVSRESNAHDLDTENPETPVISTATSAENPVSASPSGSQDNDLAATEDNDDSFLPPLPQPPAAHSFAVLIGLATSVPFVSDSDQVPLDKAIAAYFDPAFFSRFGPLPASPVLVHLMRYTATLVEHRRFAQIVDNNEASP